MPKNNLGTEICGVKFSNPTILASGILGVIGSSMVNVINNGAGGIVTKSISLKKREGNKAPLLLTYEAGMMNCVGLSSLGIENSIKEIELYKKQTKAPIITSIFASSAEEFGQVAREISSVKPDLIEVNISCPNVESEFGKPFGTNPKVAAEITKIVKSNTNIPIVVKLSPNVTDIVEIALAVEEAGADAISAINTVGPGMVINVEIAKPLLSNKVGGVSGPAIRPIAVRAVYEIYKKVKIPIMGIGGITTGKDVIEMMMAGASAVQIGSAVYYRGVSVFKKVCKEAEELLDQLGYSQITEVIGKAHEE